MVLSTSTSYMHSSWIHLPQQHSTHSRPVSISSSYVPKQTQQRSVWIVSSMSPLALFRLGRGTMLEVGFLFRAFSSEFFCFSSAFLTFAASLSAALRAFSLALRFCSSSLCYFLNSLSSFRLSFSAATFCF